MGKCNVIHFHKSHELKLVHIYLYIHIQSRVKRQIYRKYNGAFNFHFNFYYGCCRLFQYHHLWYNVDVLEIPQLTSLLFLAILQVVHVYRIQELLLYLLSKHLLNWMRNRYKLRVDCFHVIVRWSVLESGSSNALHVIRVTYVPILSSNVKVGTKTG